MNCQSKPFHTSAVLVVVVKSVKMEMVDDGEVLLDTTSAQITTSNPPLSSSSSPKGGLITMPFIIVNETFEKLASYGLSLNMIKYLMSDYHMSLAHGSVVLLLWSSISSFSPMLGASLSDSHLGRFRVIGLGSLCSFLGVILLWLTTMIPKVKPPFGDAPSSSQLALLFSSFFFMSIGAGGIRPCSIAFGADQLIKTKDNNKDKRTLQTYFSWYYTSVGLSVVISMIFIVYIQDHLGWRLGFGVPTILMFLSVLSFFLGSPLYVKVKPNKSSFASLAQVIVVSFKNRTLPYPADCRYHCSKESGYLVPSEHLSFLNKACIIKDSDNVIDADGSTSKPWCICTVQQVEALKSVIRILPIWSTGIIIFMTISQGTFTVLQAGLMDRHLTSNFEVPAATFSVFTVITLTIWIALYDLVMVPLLARFTSQPRGLSNMVRMGTGLLLSSVAMLVAAIVESIRRKKTIQEMSAFWLVPQFCLSGLAEALNAVGQIEFYYSQLPKNMGSHAMALFSLNNAFAGLLGSFLVETVNRVTRQGGKPSWLYSDLNKGHYDYFCWLLAILNAANFLYFLLCCWAYGPSKEVDPNASCEQLVVL